MADQEETFGLQNSPSGSDSRDLQNDDNNKSEKQNGTSSKSPSSQTTYIQQVSIGQSGDLSVCEARLLSTIYGVTSTLKVFKHTYSFVQRSNLAALDWSRVPTATELYKCDHITFVT